MMMPKKHLKDDAQWIKEQLQKLPPVLQKTACDGYTKVFQETYDACTCDISRENKARRAANTRLREYVDAIAKNQNKL